MKPTPRRDPALDGAKTFAIFGTLLIHVTAVSGFVGEVGSFAWTSNLFWSSILRCAVPVFLLCSGSLFLDPGRPLSLKSLWGKYIPRIAVALVFWGVCYVLWGFFITWTNTGVWDLGVLRQGFHDIRLLHFREHLYYLQITLLLYALFPLVRAFVAKADAKLLGYGLGCWFLLGCALPTLYSFDFMAPLYGIPREYALNLTYGAVGYGALGYALRREGHRFRAAHFAALFLLGFLLTFGGTLLLSLHRGEFGGAFLGGTSPTVCLQAVGLYGFCLKHWENRPARKGITVISQASFCVYLVHLFFLDWLVEHGLCAGVYLPLWAAPLETLVIFAGSLLVWLVLRRIPLVNRCLI